MSNDEIRMTKRQQQWGGRLARLFGEAANPFSSSRVNLLSSQAFGLMAGETPAPLGIRIAFDGQG